MSRSRKHLVEGSRRFLRVSRELQLEHVELSLGELACKSENEINALQVMADLDISFEPGNFVPPCFASTEQSNPAKFVLGAALESEQKEIIHV